MQSWHPEKSAVNALVSTLSLSLRYRAYQQPVMDGAAVLVGKTLPRPEG